MLMTVEIDHVEAFVAVVRQGGVTRAAGVLHVSQPAISRRLHLLEDELGAPLFERLLSGVRLTEAGHAFLPHAEALLATMRDGRDAVAALAQPDRGAVTLALVGTLASTDLTARLKALRAAHPNVELRLRTALSVEVSALVRRGDATLGLRYGHDASPELVGKVVHQERRIVVCAPEHRLAAPRQRRALAPSRLRGEAWIDFPPRTDGKEPYAASLAHRLAACGLAGAEVIGIDSLTAQKRMVEAGFGLALLPESCVDEELRAGTLRTLRVPALHAITPVVLIHRRRAYLSGAARMLAGTLAA
jgi:DNA-binding transcriptional LysR family regulator